MNIESQNINLTEKNINKSIKTVTAKDSETNFADELNIITSPECAEETSATTVTTEEVKTEKKELATISDKENKTKDNIINNGFAHLQDTKNTIAENKINSNKEKTTQIKDNIITKNESDNSTNKIYEQKNNRNFNNALENLNSIVKEFNQSDEKSPNTVKIDKEITVNTDKMNDDLSIQDIRENKEILPQMNPSMNFSSEGQPFSSLMDEEKNTKKTLNRNIQEIAEEAAILSTMAENIAIANKNKIQEVPKTIEKQEIIKEPTVRTTMVFEKVVDYESIIMNRNDVEVFVDLVENKEVNIKNLTENSNIEKSIKISKTLADMLAKSMEKSQPLRIDFDNNISVIIKISRDGKLIADFLPSSQVAEAYLKENLPLLRQRFDDNNIEYDSLNQRERKEQDKESNKKKGRNNE